MARLDDIIMVRDVPTKLFRFTDYFKGFEKVPAVRSLFGDKTD
jgi:hypothetical protein